MTSTKFWDFFTHTTPLSLSMLQGSMERPVLLRMVAHTINIMPELTINVAKSLFWISELHQLFMQCSVMRTKDTSFVPLLSRSLPPGNVTPQAANASWLPIYWGAKTRNIIFSAGKFGRSISALKDNCLWTQAALSQEMKRNGWNFTTNLISWKIPWLACLQKPDFGV